MECIQPLPESEDIFYNRDYIVFLHKPTTLDNLPNIDESFIHKKYLTICNPEYINTYFNHIINDNIRLQIFNGINMNECSYRCDYCNTSINDDWYYCFHCYKDMCKLCYQEVDEETAIKHGATNYKTRENALHECRTCNIIQPRPIYDIDNLGNKSCDLCHTSIELLHPRYSIRETNNSLDICTECYTHKEDARNMVETKEMKLFTKENKKGFLFTYTDFNSLCYWIPIISDEHDCHVFMNLNPDDNHYGKVCLQSCDDHGRYGYFIIQDESITLDVLLTRLKEITDKGVYEYEEVEIVEKGVYEFETVEQIEKDVKVSWRRRKTIKEPVLKTITKTAELGSNYYSGPIHILMKEFGMPMYYG